MTKPDPKALPGIQQVLPEGFDDLRKSVANLDYLYLTGAITFQEARKQQETQVRLAWESAPKHLETLIPQHAQLRQLSELLRARGWREPGTEWTWPLTEGPLWKMSTVISAWGPQRILVMYASEPDTPYRKRRRADKLTSIEELTPRLDNIEDHLTHLWEHPQN